MKIKRSLVVLGCIMVLVLLGLTGCTSGSGSSVNTNNQQQGIWVNGHGEVHAAPDIATLQLGISSQRKTVAEAQAEAATSMDKIMSALRNKGVADKDIQTQYFSIQQVTRWDQDNQENVVIGYLVSNMVVAKIREIEKAGSIIDSVVMAGGDLTRIDGISFSIDDPAEYRIQARDKAIADAKAKAEQLANLSGVTLSKPTYISETISSPVYSQTVRVPEAAVAPATSISPGEMKVSIDVQVVYGISN